MTSRHADLPGSTTHERTAPTFSNVTFISIHDLSPEARILYSSESIIDVLGYTPDQIVNRSLWDFFPEEEVPHAKAYHKHGIDGDKAAMLAYCRVKNSEGEWIGCECCFTVVYDVMVVCTSIYRSGMSSQKRALEAPVIRRLFSSSPKDPRYHMLSHISQKFRQPQKPEPHEPRAALFLNRFTRTLTIMYATSSIEEIIGISSSALQGKSFYYCIAENCLSDAVRCLENAKGNDSIAYMRFWFRDPRHNEPSYNDTTSVEDSDEEMATDSSIDQEYSGGVHLTDDPSSGEDSRRSEAVRSDSSMDIDDSGDHREQSRTSSGDSTNPHETHESIFDTLRPSDSSSSSAPVSPDRPQQDLSQMIELEAVVSCASDGLVVCLRRARPMMPESSSTAQRPAYRNGLFAAPWADEPLIPPITERPAFAINTAFAPSLGPQGARHRLKADNTSKDDFMNSIREQAVFAWALTGINGSLETFATGVPQGESIPRDGLPIWQVTNTPKIDSRNQSTGEGSHAAHLFGKIDDWPSGNKDAHKIGATGNDHRGLFGDPGMKPRQSSISNPPMSPVDTRSPTDARSSHGQFDSN